MASKSRYSGMTEALHVAKANQFVAYLTAEKCYVNLAGSYDYLESPYYVSQDHEDRGDCIHPTCKEMLDAYVTPLFLARARQEGLAVPEYYITNSYFEPPVVVDPINPFLSRSRTVFKISRQESAAKSLTRNFKYAISCQELPEGASISHFRAVLGWCANRTFRDTARPIWNIFRLPLAMVRVVVLPDATMLLSDLSQLPFQSLRKRELDYLLERVTWRG